MKEADKCQAQVSHKVIKQGQADGMYDLSGIRHSLPQGQKESLTVEETTITCARCNILKVLKTQGVGFAAYNEGVRQAKQYLMENCGKWKERVEKGEVKGTMLEELLP